MPDRGGAWHPLIELTLARLREFVREPEAVFWVFAFPLLLACALGIAFGSRTAPPAHVGVMDGPAAAETAAEIARLPGFEVRLIPRDRADVALRNGEVSVLVLPGSPPAYRYDASRPEGNLARLAVDDALQRARGRADCWTAVEERVEAAGSRYVDWVLPGLIGLNVMGTSLWSVGYAIVQTRTRKLLKRLAATPMSRGQYLLSYLLARLIFLGLEVPPLLALGWIAFGVPVRGSLVALLAVAFLGAVSFGGIGLLLASRSRTVEAVSGWMNAVSVPMWVLSGVFFSSAHFPAAMQPLIQALPLTALNDGLRAVMLDGLPIVNTWPELALLAGWGGAGYVLALRTFRWE